MNLRARPFRRSIFALLALAACTRSAPPPPEEILDASANPPAIGVVLPDAGAQAIAEAQAALQAAHPDTPLRLSLIAELRDDNLIGLAPGEPSVKLGEKLGPALEKRAESGSETWRWPQLGVEAAVREGKIARIALHASRRPEDPEMRKFVGEVLLGGEPLTKLAPRLKLTDIGVALGEAQAKRQSGGPVVEQAWLRGRSTLYLTFDKDSQELEAIVLEPFDEQIWAAMHPVVAPSPSAASSGPIEFAQVPPELDAKAASTLRPIAKNRPGASALFAAIESDFLGKGDRLRTIDGRRAAMLRANGCAFVLLEDRGGKTWSSLNPNSPCAPDAEAAGEKQLEQELAKAK